MEQFVAQMEKGVRESLSQLQIDDLDSREDPSRRQRAAINQTGVENIHTNDVAPALNERIVAVVYARTHSHEMYVDLEDPEHADFRLA